MKRDGILDWQRRFLSAPGVWLTYVSGEWTGNAYESQEAAEREIAWHAKRSRKPMRAVLTHVHTAALSEKRWR